MKGLFWNFVRADTKFEDEKEKKRKKMIVSAKLEVFLVHALYHYVEGDEIF